MGRSALNDHAKRKRHLDIIEEWQKYTNTNFFKPPSSTEPMTSTTETLNFESNSLIAEILWCLNMVNQHLSYNFCSHVSEIFSAMFPDSEVAQKCSMEKTKSRYMIIYGSVPYFNKELLKKINSFSFYSVSFDESFNSELQKCQLMFVIGTQGKILLLYATLIQCF